jgi:hypothetical protein
MKGPHALATPPDRFTAREEACGVDDRVESVRPSEKLAREIDRWLRGRSKVDLGGDLGKRVKDLTRSVEAKTS